MDVKQNNNCNFFPCDLLSVVHSFYIRKGRNYNYYSAVYTECFFACEKHRRYGYYFTNTMFLSIEFLTIFDFKTEHVQPLSIL